MSTEFHSHSSIMPFINALSALAIAAARHVLTILQVVPPPPPPPPMMGRRPKTLAQSPVPRRASCTHITMNRLHGNNICHMCGKLPELGWLYACRQDWLIEHQQDPVATAAESAIVVPDESNYFEVMSRYAVSLKMSSSVVKQIHDGQYDYEQVERLIAQKEHLISTIKKMEGMSTESTPASLHANVFQSNSSIIASLGATVNSSNSNQQQPSVSLSPTTAQQTSTNKNNSAPATAKSSQIKPDRCNYMVCHGCRPFLHERLYANIGSVLDGALPPIFEEETNTLHMLDTNIVRGFGQPKKSPESPLSPRRL